MRRRGWVIVGVLAALAGVPVAASLRAADKTKPSAKPAEPKPEAYLTPETAGPDFLVQGEYVGEVEAAGGTKSKLAAQVVALGDRTFQAAFLAGGLPGDGWDGKTRVVVPGKGADPAGGEVAFAPESGQTGYTATISSGVLRGKTDAGAAFELKRVERKSPTMGAKPPPGAVVLFDGTNTEEWVNGKLDERHLLAAGTETKRKFSSFTLHGEFLLPFKPKGKDQDRGNSGFYLHKRYEVQVLDSFGQPAVFNGTGALYRQVAPKLNMCLPPLQWQTYDIDFTAPTFDASGAKTKNAVITVRLNGVVIHDKQELVSKTGAGQKEGPEPGPILLQGHGNPVFFRNIWVVEK